LSRNLITVIEDRRSSPELSSGKFCALSVELWNIYMFLRLFLHYKASEFSPSCILWGSH